MCMEDVKIGRSTYFRSHVSAVSTVSSQLASGDPNRRALIFSAPLTGTLTISPNTPVVSGFGINIAALGNPLILTQEDFGLAVTLPWYGILSAGNDNVFVGSSQFVRIEDGKV